MFESGFNLRDRCFICQWLVKNKKRTWEQAIDELICFKMNERDNFLFIGKQYSWFKDPNTHTTAEMYEYMVPIIEKLKTTGQLEVKK